MVEQRRRAVFNWSGGKDSALALQTVLREDRYEVVSLLTTVDASNDRSSMHGIPAELLRMQADSIGLPIRIVPTGKGIEDYERAMAEAVGDFVARGAEHFIFGDIFLQDVRAYRERQLKPYGVTVVEPLWGRSTERFETICPTVSIRAARTANIIRSAMRAECSAIRFRSVWAGLSAGATR